VARIRTRTEVRPDDKSNHKAAVVAERRRKQDEVIEEVDDMDEMDDAYEAKGRPTPSSNELKPRGVGSTGLINRIPVLRNVVAYFRGVVSEMQKVSWPTRGETRYLTTIVLGVTVFFAVSLGVMDAFLAWWFRKAFHADSEGMFLLIALAVAVVVSGGYFLLRNYLREGIE
jgi:preprotein translocase SecE subunit